MRAGQPAAPGAVLTRSPASGRPGGAAPTTIGATAGAWTLAALVAVVMVLAGDPARTLLVLVLVAGQVVLALLAHRTVGPSSWRRVPVLWSAQAGLTWAVAGDPTAASALVYLVVGIVFALVAEGVLRLVGRFAEPPVVDQDDLDEDDLDEDDLDEDELGVGPARTAGPRTDTAPLPVAGGPDDDGAEHPRS